MHPYVPFVTPMLPMHYSYYLCSNVDNSREPGKIPGCQLDFRGLISPRGMVPLGPSSGSTAQITAYQVQNSGCQNVITTSLLNMWCLSHDPVQSCINTVNLLLVIY